LKKIHSLNTELVYFGGGLMKHYTKLALLFSILLLLVSACGTDQPEDLTNNNDLISNQEPASGDGTGPVGLDDQRNRLEIIQLEPAILSAGETLQVSTQQAIDGEITISQNGEVLSTHPFSGSSAALNLPSDIPDGQYLVEIFAQNGLVGVSTFRVSAAPGVWLRTDRSFADSQSSTILQVKSYLLPEDSLGAIYLTAPDGSSIPFVPDESGNLVPGLAVATSEFLDRDLYLDQTIHGTIVFKANKLDLQGDQTTDQWVSNSVSISACQQPSSISGKMQGSGYVNAIWMNGQIQSNTIYTDSGAYQLDVGPGFVVVQTIADSTSGYQFDQQVLGITCGEEIQLSADLDILSKTVAGFQDAQLALIGSGGVFSGTSAAIASAGSQDEICRQGLIDSSVTINGQPDPAAAKAAGFALKAALATTSPRFSAVTQSDIVDLLQEAVNEAMETDGEVNLDQVNAALATDFLIRLTATTLGESFPLLVRSIKFLEGDQQVTTSGMSSPESLGQANNSIYTDFAEKFSHSAICGQVDPEEKTVKLGDQVPLTYKVLDLSGGNADGAKVSVSDPECGTLSPDSGTIQSGLFETTYQFPEDQFCTEELDFSAEWGSPVGQLKTRPHEAIARISAEKAYMKLSVGYIPGIGNQNANIVEVATVYEDWEEARAPGDLPPIAQAGDCKFIDDGQTLVDQFWYKTVTSPGKRAESSFSVLSYSDLTKPINEYSTNKADHFLLRMHTYAWAVPVEDDTPAREASAYAGNGSIISMGLPSTAFIIDIYNPGELPITPIVNWNSSVHNDDGAYSGMIFYKIISCGTDAGLESYGAFLGGNIQMLYYFDDEEGGELSGLATLPEMTDQRTQIVLYIVNYSIATSIRDDADGIYHSSLNKLTTEVDIYLSQEINSSQE
jgi:hypothetical protein